MTDLFTLILEVRPRGAPEVPDLIEFQRLLARGPVNKVGEIVSLRLALCSYSGLLQLQTRRVHAIRRACERELRSLEELAARAAEAPPKRAYRGGRHDHR